MNTKYTIALAALFLTATPPLFAQTGQTVPPAPTAPAPATPTYTAPSADTTQPTPKGNDVTTSLQALQPDYPVPSRIPSAADITATLNRIRTYLEAVTPARFYDRATGAPVDPHNPDTNTVFQPGDFRLTSYEWGVTYSGMLQAGEATGDRRFTDYTRQRLEFMAGAVPAFRSLYTKYKNRSNPLRPMIDPHALDDAGAICAAMVKTLRSGGAAPLRPVIHHYIDYIYTKEFRLPDGTLARACWPGMPFPQK